MSYFEYNDVYLWLFKEMNVLRGINFSLGRTAGWRLSVRMGQERARL